MTPPRPAACGRVLAGQNFHSPTSSGLDHGTARVTRQPAPDSRPAGGYTVLVVDDEEPVRRLASAMLTWTGYQAIEASHGREAMDAIEQHAGPDPPGAHGHQDARDERAGAGPPFVEQRWPGKPILYMSGFASEVFRGGLLEPGAPFLAKPFTQEDLATKVRGLLNGGRVAPGSDSILCGTATESASVGRSGRPWLSPVGARTPFRWHKC